MCISVRARAKRFDFKTLCLSSKNQRNKIEFKNKYWFGALETCIGFTNEHILVVESINAVTVLFATFLYHAHLHTHTDKYQRESRRVHSKSRSQTCRNRVPCASLSLCVCASKSHRTKNKYSRQSRFQVLLVFHHVIAVMCDWSRSNTYTHTQAYMHNIEKQMNNSNGNGNSNGNKNKHMEKKV